MQGSVLTDVVVRRWSQAVPVPWRNGGGVTRELLREPLAGDRFEWRVSVAEVTEDGPFSAFEGYDRVLVLLSGEGIDLHPRGGAVVPVRPPFGMHRFPGELPIDATLPSGPTTDFNLIWHRGATTAAVEVVRLDGARLVGGARVTLCFVADGVARLDGHRLEAGDLACLRRSQRMEGSATIVVCSLSSTHA